MKVREKPPTGKYRAIMVAVYNCMSLVVWGLENCRRFIFVVRSVRAAEIGNGT